MDDRLSVCLTGMLSGSIMSTSRCFIIRGGGVVLFTFYSLGSLIK